MLDKLAALAAELVLLALVLWLALVVGVEAIGMDVSVAHLAAATVAAALFAFVYGAIALFLGAATGRRAVATGIAAAGAVAAYLLSRSPSSSNRCSRCALPRPSTTTPPATHCARAWPPAIPHSCSCSQSPPPPPRSSPSSAATSQAPELGTEITP